MRFLVLLLTFTISGSMAFSEDSADRFNSRLNAAALLQPALIYTFDFKIAEQWTLGPELELSYLGINSDNT